MPDKSYTVRCDKCGKVAHADAPDWATFWAARKGEGWRAYKDGNKWMHECGACPAPAEQVDDLPW
jgi:transposase